MGNTQTYKHRHNKHKQSNNKESNNKQSNSAYSPKKHYQRTRRHRHRHTRKQRGGGFLDFFRGKKSEPTAAVPASGDAAPAVAAGVPGPGFLASIKDSATGVLDKGNNALVGLNESVATGVTGKISSIKAVAGEKAGIVSNLFGNSDPPPTGAPPAQAGGRRRKTNRKRSGHGRKHKKH